MRNILLAIDFSASTPHVIRQGESLAKAFSAKLWLVHVVIFEPDFVGYEAGPPVPMTTQEAIVDSARAHLEAEAQSLQRTGIEIETILAQGATVASLLEQANRVNADAIIIGSHGHGALYRMLMGSVSQGVVSGANCPVMVIPSRKTNA